MLDLYHFLVPIYAIITLATLYSLKLALRDNNTASRIAEAKLTFADQQCAGEETTPLRKSLRFLLRRFTVAEFCTIGRGQYKLPLLMSISLISIAAFCTHLPFAFCFVGTVVSVGFMISGLLAVGTGPERPLYRQKYLHVVFSILSIILNFLMIGLLFKNYMNSQLRTFLSASAINIALDFFAVRPVMLLILGAAFSRNQKYMDFVVEEEKILNMVEIFEKMKGKEALNKPIGKMFSPSKLAKCVPVNLEIEPVPIATEESNKGPFEKAPRQLNPLRLPQMDSIEKSLDLLRMIKKEKSAPPGLATPLRRHRFEDSQNSLLNSTNKDHSPLGPRHFQQFDAQHQQDKAAGQTDPALPLKDQMPPSHYSQRKFGSENVIMINPSRQEPIQNQEDEPTNPQGGRRKTTEGSIEEQHFDFSKKPTIQMGDQLNNPLKISLNSSGPSSRNEPLRICLNGEEQRFPHQGEEDMESDRFRRRRETIDVDSREAVKNTLGVLEIKEHHHCEEIEELDLNSPERRRHIMRKEEQASRMEARKKKKKMSHDERNRVIRFTTGEPYLEYLPNMLNRQASKKKTLAKKELVIDSRTGKKQKRRDINFENNQNVVPSFRVEDY